MTDDHDRTPTDEERTDAPASSDADGIPAVDAFGLLAHETRLAAVRALWAADRPLRFSEVADRAGVTDTGNFNYHFGQLVGHFVRETGDEYELTRSGRQAMTAVLAGDVTDRPAFGPVELDERCPFCDAPVELAHDADVLRVRCSDCPGNFHGEHTAANGTPNPEGTITTFAFPAAGLRERDPETVLDVALVRLLSRWGDMTSGVCPDCAGPVDRTATVCDDHADDGVCEHCTSRFVGLLTARCGTCSNTRSGLLALAAFAHHRVRRYFEDHGHDPLEPTWSFALAVLALDERVHDTDPLHYEASWRLDDERLRVHVDDDGQVTRVHRD